ncbi:MAG: cobalamin-binding protein [Armatimonadetes bacterium CG_4_9_14_3_um_filter_58_7]|nr:MAG: cobalamin-binding protein [Armatimonadetes bacterium CG_4_9_14_3_um_filter_58_7]
MDFAALSEAVINGDRNAAVKLTEEGLARDVLPQDILQKGLVAGMDVVGKKFKANEFYVPEVLVAARAMKSAMALLRPKLAEANIEGVAKVVIGTVRGDLHDIGVDCSPEKFIQGVKEKGGTVVAMSALLTTTMPSMKDTIAEFESAGIRGDVKMMIGGAPITQDYADSIGADGYAPDAASAVDLAKELLAA